jgi:peptide deformylase
MVKILQMGDPILRQVCAPVSLDDIPKKLLKDLKEAVFSQADGVAIAAPQIGSALRVFYVAGSVLKKAEPDKYTKELKKVDKDVLRLTGSSPGIEATLIDRPEEIV